MTPRAERTGRRLRRLILAFILAAIVLFGRASVAAAHASLLRSSPSQDAVLQQGPTLIRLWFSEQIDLPVHAFEVQGPDGKPVQIGRAQTASDDDSEMIGSVRATQQGTYVVRWKVISADTHPVWGSFTFSVGYATPIASTGGNGSPAYNVAVVALQAAGRWLTLAGATLLIGAPVLWWWTLGTASSEIETRERRRAWRRLVRLGGWGSILVFIAAPLTLLAQMAALSDTWAETFDSGTFLEVLGARVGLIAALRLVLALICWVISGILQYLDVPPPSAGRHLPPLARAQVWLGLPILLSSALADHAISTDPIWLSLPLDWLHLMAMAVWVGGLVGLAYALPPLLAPPGGDLVNARLRHWKVLGGVIPSFSRLALASLIVLGITGLYAALRNISAPDQLVDTAYGRALLVKLGLLVLVLLSAAINLLVLGLAVRRVARGASPKIRDIWPLFRPLVRIEATLLMVLLIAVGVLTSVAPARQAAEAMQGGNSAIPVTVQAVVDSGPHAVFAGTLGSTLITLIVAPAPSGNAQVAASLLGPERPVTAKNVTLRLVPPARSGAATVNAAMGLQAPGQYATSVPLGTHGIWALQVAVVLQNGRAADLDFSLDMPLQPGAALLRQLDATTNRLHSEVMDQSVSAGQPPVRFTYAYQAPDREHFTSPGNVETYRIGTKNYTRLPSQPWQVTTLDQSEGFIWPDSTYARQGPDATVTGYELVDGHRCALVSYWIAYPNAVFRIWVDQQTHLARKLILLYPGHFERDLFHDYNQAPLIVAPR